MNILLTGGTGLIGRHLTVKLQAMSYNVTVLTRNCERARQILDPKTSVISSLTKINDLNEFDAVINLAGEPIAKRRWSNKQKKCLCYSRWNITNQLSDMIIHSNHPPSVFISGSATGYYGDQGDNIIDEYESPIVDFPYVICSRWEDLALRAHSKKTRVCLSRTGLVLAADGGLLQKLLPTYKLGLGGPIGDGAQFIPWIHISDVVNALIFMLTNSHLAGPFNVCSPYPVRNKHFSKLLAKILRRPCLISIPAWTMRLFIGESSLLVLGGQRVVPRRLIEYGFDFYFVDLEKALKEIISA